MCKGDLMFENIRKIAPSQTLAQILALAFVLMVPALITGAANAQDERLQPFVQGYNTSGDYAAAVAEVKEKLTAGGFTIVGDYSAYEGTTVIGVTNDALLAAAAETDFGGYGAVQRVSVAQVGDEIQVSYTNPVYMGVAYRYETGLEGVRASLEAALGNMGDYGSKKGIKRNKLPKYRYMLGMERFNKKSELAEYGSHEEAVAAVEAGLAAKAGGVGKVWRVDVPGTDQVLFGVSLSKECSNDSFIMSEIDFKDVRSAAHLPYEILVTGNEVRGLFARYRIAMNFPDLSMMGSNSFMNIMCSPGDIRDALRAAAGNPKD